MLVEILLIGTGLALTALLLLTIVQATAKSKLQQNRVANYFMLHSAIFQCLFYLMFLSFPITVLFASLQTITENNQNSMMEMIVILFYFWPIFMWRIHWAFVDFSMKLGISSRTVTCDDSIVFANQKVIVWIIAIVVTIFGFIAYIGYNSSFWGILFIAGMLSFTPLIFYLPIRPPIALIRNHRKKSDEYWEIAS